MDTKRRHRAQRSNRTPRPSHAGVASHLPPLPGHGQGSVGWRGLKRVEVQAERGELPVSVEAGRRRAGGWALRNIPEALLRKRVVGPLNVFVFVVLMWQMASIARMGGDFDVRASLLDSMRPDELPYPLNIVVQVHRKNFTDMPVNVSKSDSAGFVEVRRGTFRYKYPSRVFGGSGTFDEVFVLSNEMCPQQLREFENRAHALSLPLVDISQQDARDVSLERPSMPISQQVAAEVSTGSKVAHSVLKRQISYLRAHHTVWRHVVDSSRQRVLVIDDTLFPTHRLQKSLPAVLSNADQESVARQKPWHVVFLRRIKLRLTDKEETWTMNPVHKQAVVVANVSHGAGAYVLSLDGARFLLRHVVRYRAPLDIELGLLQQEFPEEFVALSACYNKHPTAFCPEMTQDITQKSTRAYDCLWRRMQEQFTASTFKNYFH